MGFKTITQKELDGFGEPIYYGGGRQIQVGDKVIFGYINMYSNLRGIPTTTFNNHDEIGLSFQMFVFNGDEIYQTYRLK
jgi:hypothetical protein